MWQISFKLYVRAMSRDAEVRYEHKDSFSSVFMLTKWSYTFLILALNFPPLLSFCRARSYLLDHLRKDLQAAIPDNICVTASLISCLAPIVPDLDMFIRGLQTVLLACAALLAGARYKQLACHESSTCA